MQFQNFKTSLKHVILYCFYILSKITLTTANRSKVLHNFLLLDMSVFNEIVIKNVPVKKSITILCFHARVHLPDGKVLVLGDRNFYVKVLSKLHHNRNFNILVKFNFVLPTSKKIIQFNHEYFKLGKKAMLALPFLIK